MPLKSLPSCLGGRYRPLRDLGSGGMGSVYLVEHLHTGERLALKLLRAQARLDQSAIERFKREARITVRLKSEHVVHVVDADVADEVDGAPFLVMELLEGQDLGALAAEGPLPPGDVVEWLRQAARGLDRAHAAGIVHRDLKPENLFLTRRDDGSPLVKVLDFGVAKILDSDETERARTVTGTVFGTPLYMAPEQATGRTADLGPPADFWSLAMVAYRLLTGEPYWRGTTRAHVLAQIVYEPVVSPSARGHDLGEAFDRWFLRSCRPDAASRWPSAGAQIASLAEALGQPAAVTTSGPPVAAPRPELASDYGPPALVETAPNAPGPVTPEAFAAADPPPSSAGASPARPRSADEMSSQALASLTSRASASPDAATTRRRIIPILFVVTAAAALAIAVASRPSAPLEGDPHVTSIAPRPPPPAPTRSAEADLAPSPRPPPALSQAPSAAPALASSPPKPPALKPAPLTARPKAAPSAPSPKPAVSLDPWDRD